MLDHTTDIRDIREILLALLSNSGTLAGISLALVGILNLKPITSTVGRDEEMVRNYIKHQEEEDKRIDQLNLF